MLQTARERKNPRAFVINPIYPLRRSNYLLRILPSLTGRGDVNACLQICAGAPTKHSLKLVDTETMASATGNVYNESVFD